MLHAGMAAALAHGVIEEIIRNGRAERLDIAEPEAFDRFRRELKLRDRDEFKAVELSGGALAFGIETADRFQGVAEKIEAHRLDGSGGIEIDDAAANRVVTGLAHGRGARESIELQPRDDALHGEHIAGRDRQRLAGDKFPLGHALERGVYAGKENRRP